MKLYHGTSNQIAKSIKTGNININLGSGEFGKGFYTGDLMFRAINWAKHIYKKDSGVIEFTLQDNDFESLDPLCLDKVEAINYRNKIKKNSQTQTYMFNRNAIWGPVVGKEFENYEQVKFESKNSESYINSNIVTRKKVI